MDEEDITLPSLPRFYTESSEEFQLPQNTPVLTKHGSRKRSTRHYELQQDDDAISSLLHTSSDPALFSSDETPDAENYTGGKRRKKKTYAGTWWGERLTGTRSSSGSRRPSSHGSSRRVKRKFTRNFDSGVFMNSDEGSTDFSSDSSFGADFLEDQRRTENLLQTKLPQTPVQQKSKLSLSFGSPSSPGPRSAKKQIHVDAREQHVMSVIRQCLEDSKEDVDLTGMNLEELPPAVRELATMIKDDPASSLQFESLVARPRLYLSNNVFRVFPSPVLELTNLRLLSLRQNKLTRLPPGIRNLIKLETLNISGNRFEYLPVEVLDLMSHHRLVELQSEPNPWLTPTEDQKNSDPGKTRISNRPRLYIGADHISEQEGYHTLMSLVATSHSQPLIKNEAAVRSMVPPLSEMVLRQLSKLNQAKHDLIPLMPLGISLRVSEQLSELYAAQKEGDRQCTRCKRGLVVPAEKWIEWWDIRSRGMSGPRDILNQDSPKNKLSHVLPFEVGVCSECQ